MASSENYDKDKLLIDIKKRIKDGFTATEIREWVKANHKISSQAVVFLMGEAKANYQRELDFNFRDIMIKHSSRYEQIWSKNYKNPYSKKLQNPDDDLEDKDVRKTLFKIAKHYMTAAKALQAKEKMLGIVHNRMDVELKNEFFEQTKEDDVQLDTSKYDLSKLTMEEKIEFLHLLKKAKGEVQEAERKITTTITVKNGNAEQSVKFEPVVDKFDVEDIEHEEVMEHPPLIAAEGINNLLAENEAKKVHEIFNKQLEEDRKLKLQKIKSEIIKKYKKNT